MILNGMLATLKLKTHSNYRDFRLETNYVISLGGTQLLGLPRTLKPRHRDIVSKTLTSAKDPQAGALSSGMFSCCYKCPAS